MHACTTVLPCCHTALTLVVDCEATDACLALRSQRPESDQVVDEVQDCLLQLKEVLELDAGERLRKAKVELNMMVERMEAMKQAMEDDIALKGKLTEIDVRCIDLTAGRNPDGTFTQGDVRDFGEWDASVAPWGSSQVQWNRILQNFDDKELEGEDGVISMEDLFNIATETCSDLDDESLIKPMVVAADRDDDGTINHEEYIRVMRQFVLFHSTKSAIHDAKRLRAEVDRVIAQLDDRANAAHALLMDSLRQSMATVGSYLSQLEDLPLILRIVTMNKYRLSRLPNTTAINIFTKGSAADLMWGDRLCCDHQHVMCIISYHISVLGADDFRGACGEGLNYLADEFGVWDPKLCVMTQ